MSARYGFSGLNRSLNARTTNNASTQTSLGLKGLIIQGRVKSIVLDDTHPRFEELGGWNSIGTIEYTSITEPTDSDLPTPTARCIYPNIKTFPLLNELVYLMAMPNTDIGENTTGADYYYFNPISIWNHPHHNAYPATTTLSPSQQKDFQQTQAGSVRRVEDNSSEINLGQTFTEKADIHPLLPFEGDTLLEGRFGNSVRLGSTVLNKQTGKPTTTWSEGQSNTGDPITIIRNGQPTDSSDEGWIPTTENINKDLSSIYLTSTQNITLQLASPQTTAFKTPPTTLFNKPQIILNADRLVLNSRTDSVLINSGKYIGLSAQESVNILGNDNIVLDSKKIQLGSTTAIQPILKGDDTVTQLKQIVTTLSELMKVFEVVAVPLPGGEQSIRLQTVNAASRQAREIFTTVLATLDDLKSKTVFTL